MRLRLLLVALGAIGASAVGGALPASANQGSDVKVYDYAVDHPVDDSPLPIPPSLGETVPRAVSLVPLSEESGYAYFYYNGSPVIVDLKTRSVVRFGQ